VIPELRKLGYFVERTKRPKSRGIRYRIYRMPDEPVTTCLGGAEFKLIAAALIAGKSLPIPLPPYSPAGRRSACVYPGARYL